MSMDGDEAEEALFSGEQELRLMAETIPALVWRAGPDGNNEYVNKRVLDYFGAPLGEIVGGVGRKESTRRTLHLRRAVGSIISKLKILTT
jgi:PAS domain-containing protein